MTSLPFDNAKPVQLLHLWDKRVVNARTGEIIFTLSQASRQTRFISLRPVLVVTNAATKTQICTIRTGRLRESSIRITMPDCRIKISNKRHRWEFTPTTTDVKTPWIWQRDRTGVLPSVILTDMNKDARTLARISANLVSLPSMDLTADTWTEIVVTAIGIAEHVRRQRRFGGVMGVSGGITMSSDGGNGGGGGDGGGGCGGDGGGGGGGGGDGGS